MFGFPADALTGKVTGILRVAAGNDVFGKYTCRDKRNVENSDTAAVTIAVNVEVHRRKFIQPNSLKIPFLPASGYAPLHASPILFRPTLGHYFVSYLPQVGGFLRVLRAILSSSFYCLSMTLAVAEALSP